MAGKSSPSSEVTLGVVPPTLGTMNFEGCAANSTYVAPSGIPSFVRSGTTWLAANPSGMTALRFGWPSPFSSLFTTLSTLSPDENLYIPGCSLLIMPSASTRRRNSVEDLMIPLSCRSAATCEAFIPVETTTSRPPTETC